VVERAPVGGVDEVGEVGDVGEVEGGVVVGGCVGRVGGGGDHGGGDGGGSVGRVGGGGCVEVVVDEVGEVGDVGEVVVVAIQLTVNTGVLYPIVPTPVGLMVQV